MPLVAPGFCDHIDRGTLRPAIRGGKALRADHEFLDRLEGKLHHRATDGVVLVVHAINCDIDVAAVLAVNGKNRVAVLGWIVRVCRLHTWRQVREIGDITANHRQFFDLAWSNTLTDTRLQLVHEERLTGYLDNFGH